MYHHNAQEEVVFFTRAHHLKPALASVCALDSHKRHLGNQITQRVIEYIIDRNLQCETDHTMIRCDYVLEHVLGVPSFQTKQLQSLLAPLVY